MMQTVTSEMLEWPKEDFTTAIIKMLQEAIVNTHQTNENVDFQWNWKIVSANRKKQINMFKTNGKFQQQNG